MKKKICVVTGSRAEYGLLNPLLSKIKPERSFQLQIVVTGMHLSPEFGFTFREIKKDGFKINEKVEMLLSSGTVTGISKSMGLGIIGFADTFSRLKPDIVVLLGDRFEIFSAAVAAFIAKIPIAHIHGGEVTEGALDDAMRHSITKMSFLHFVSTEVYRRRVIQLGESPKRVFRVGALGMDNIKNFSLLKKEQLEKELGFTFNKRAVLVTFHPATLEDESPGSQFRELLLALNSFQDLKIIFTNPNSDANAGQIKNLINEYVKQNTGRAISFTSLGQLKYLSTIRYVDAVIGNSSSGITEAPFLGKPTVNIGDRQKGRIKAKSIIDCRPRADEIKKAIVKALAVEFKRACSSLKSPYGNGRAAEKMIRIIKKNIAHTGNLKKGFYDIGLLRLRKRKRLIT